MIELQQCDVLLRLILAHVLCDFVFHPDAMSVKRDERNPYIHISHSLVHAVVSYLLAAQWEAWYVLPVIFVTHGSIDYLKTFLKKGICFFILDQFLHLFVIFLLWLAMSGQWCGIRALCASVFSNRALLIVLVGYLLVLKPSGIFLALFTQRWSVGGQVNDSLKNAGRWIGFLERTLIYVFILLGQWEAIGFLLAAKSIFRFGELNNSKEMKLTEYVLIGTFASFALAILIGLGVHYLLA
jgi:hypothetical protein